jgi:hypothetical protein
MARANRSAFIRSEVIKTTMSTPTQQNNINPDIDTALKQIKARRKDYTRYSEYYEGEQPLTFATSKFRNAFGNLFHSLAFNVCPTVVDTLADRMTLTGFSLEDDDADKDTGEPVPAPATTDPKNDPTEIAWDIWEQNRMDQGAGEVHQDAFKMGDSYAIVWPDEQGDVQITPQPAELMTVNYDPEHRGRLRWAAKCWQEDSDGRTYLTMYYPDRIEKYVSKQTKPKSSAEDTKGTEQKPASLNTNLKSTSFEQRVVIDENSGNQEEWPLPNEYGRVPVFHFANNAGVGKFGQSELKNVLPLQNALNKSLADMLVAMEFVAFPQRWATGIEIEEDELTGQPKATFKPGADRLWQTGNEQARFGQFQVGDMSQYLDVQKELQFDIAKISRTPLHYLMLLGAPPSGEALKTLEAPFVKKCIDRQVSLGNTWEDALSFAVLIQTGQDVRLQAEWESPAPQSELELADVAIQWKAADVPDEAIWEKLGFPAEQIQTWLAQKQQAAATMQATMQPNGAAVPATQTGTNTNGNYTALPAIAENLAQSVRVAAPKLGG